MAIRLHHTNSNCRPQPTEDLGTVAEAPQPWPRVRVLGWTHTSDGDAAQGPWPEQQAGRLPPQPPLWPHMGLGLPLTGDSSIHRTQCFPHETSNTEPSRASAPQRTPEALRAPQLPPPQSTISPGHHHSRDSFWGTRADGGEA